MHRIVAEDAEPEFLNGLERRRGAIGRRQRIGEVGRARERRQKGESHG